MKKLICAACAIISLSIIICLSSCGNEKITPQSRTFYEYFDTVGTFSSYTDISEEDFKNLADRVEGLLEEYHKLYDIYNEYDGIVNLATLNRTAGNGAQKVDKKIVDMLLFAKEMYTLTSGKVNVAMGSVLGIWHDYRTNGYVLPPMEMLTDAAEHIDINMLMINESELTVELLDPMMKLDVGAIAKGYTVEMIASILENEGLSGFVLDVGGNLRAIGQKPDGSGWTAGIKNPSSPYSQTYVYKTTLSNEALVTSGTYERFYTVDGVRYHHIINEETLMPSEYYLSVSVKSDSSALSDALSTAVFNMKYEDAEKFVGEIENVFIVLVMPDGEVRTLGTDN